MITMLPRKIMSELSRAGLAAAARLSGRSAVRPASSCQALVLCKYGNLEDEEVLRLQEYPLPPVGSSDVTVEMLRSPVHPADINLIQGVYPIKPSLPAVLGGEGVGIVTEVGEAVESLRPGDHVILAIPGTGTWRTHLTAGEQFFAKVSKEVPLNLAATLVVNPQTAYRMLKDFVHLEPGDCIIQNSANSGVGQSVIQIATAWGIKTINIIRDRPDVDAMKGLLFDMGATEVVTEEFAASKEMKELVERHGRPVLGLNGVGGTSATSLMRQLATHAVMITYGGMSRKPITVSTGSFIFKDLQLRGYWNNKWVQENLLSPPHMEMIQDLNQLAMEGKLYPPLCSEHPMINYRSALARAMEPFVGRKQILVWNQ